jgi:hypothetical protein
VVFDKSTQCPLDQVNISFIDTGFDSVRSKKMIRISVGDSDTGGRINVRHDYFWGRNESIFATYPPRIFDVVLSKGSYKETVMHFGASDLIEEKDMLVVPLGEIYLEPQRE